MVAEQPPPRPPSTAPASLPATSAPAMSSAPSSALPRENMIATAIKFLQNEKVRQSAFNQRRTFLEKKGLTQEEIEIAIQRSGTAGDESLQVAASGTSLASPPQQAMVPAQPGMVAQVPVPVSAWSRTRDYLATAIVFGGVAYALYQLYKRYLAPYLFGPSAQERQLEAIQKSVEELKNSMAETLKGLQETQQQIMTQMEMKTSAAGGDVTHQISGVKDDIKSLKGLLLNRKQFPPAPVTTPVIPSWQLASSDKAAGSSGKSAVMETPSETATTSVTKAPAEVTTDTTTAGLAAAASSSEAPSEVSSSEAPSEVSTQISATAEAASSAASITDAPAEVSPDVLAASTEQSQSEDVPSHMMEAEPRIDASPSLVASVVEASNSGAGDAKIEQQTDKMEDSEADSLS